MGEKGRGNSEEVSQIDGKWNALSLQEGCCREISFSPFFFKVYKKTTEAGRALLQRGLMPRSEVYPARRCSSEDRFMYRYHRREEQKTARGSDRVVQQIGGRRSNDSVSVDGTRTAPSGDRTT